MMQQKNIEPESDDTHLMGGVHIEYAKTTDTNNFAETVTLSRQCNLLGGDVSIVMQRLEAEVLE